MVKPEAFDLAIEHLLGQCDVIFGRTAVGLECGDGLPLPTAFADLRACVNHSGELSVGEVAVEYICSGRLGVGHQAWHAGPQDFPGGNGNAQGI